MSFDFFGGADHATDVSHPRRIRYRADARAGAVRGRRGGPAGAIPDHPPPRRPPPPPPRAPPRARVASGGTQGNGASSYASISADGRYVAFNSFATNLVPA